MHSSMSSKSLTLDRSRSPSSNLLVLQRQDQHIVDVLGTAGHVVVYDFDFETNQWKRKDIEGPLFIVKRGTAPRFRLIVRNRLSTNNLVQDIGGKFQQEVIEPYMIYKSKDKKNRKIVHGIWFYDSDERDKIGILLNRVAKSEKQAEMLQSAEQQFKNVSVENTVAGSELGMQSSIPFQGGDASDISGIGSNAAGAQLLDLLRSGGKSTTSVESSGTAATARQRGNAPGQQTPQKHLKVVVPQYLTDRQQQAQVDSGKSGADRPTSVLKIEERTGSNREDLSKPFPLQAFSGQDFAYSQASPESDRYSSPEPSLLTPLSLLQGQSGAGGGVRPGARGGMIQKASTDGHAPKMQHAPDLRDGTVDKGVLQEAVLSLCKDDRFLALLQEAYTQALTTRGAGRRRS